MGFHQAGYDMYGSDIAPQKNYPFAFHQGDAIAVSALDSASVSISNALVAWGQLWESQGMDVEQLDAELRMVDVLRRSGPDAVLEARLDRLELRLLRSKLARVEADRVSDVSE